MKIIIIITSEANVERERGEDRQRTEQKGERDTEMKLIKTHTYYIDTT